LKVSIIATGNELTEGLILDRNSKYIAEKLKDLGYDTIKISNIKDDLSLIKLTILESLKISYIILVTGGLGPTQDDLTVQALSESLNIATFSDEGIYKSIQDYYYKKTKKDLDILKKQSYVLKGAKILKNPIGSAPGQKINYKGKIIYLLPGPFNEMKSIFDSYIYPELKNIVKKEFKEYTLYFYALTEAEFMDEVSNILENIDYSTKIEEYVGPSLRIRIKKNEDRENIKNEIISKFQKYYIGSKKLEIQVFEELLKSSKTISFAESCTGGMISSTLVSNSGSSKVFKGSVIAYSNELKTKLLSVQKETLQIKGAVSEETAKEMVYGLKSLINNCDIYVSVTGIAGPEGGTSEKPVGTVCFGFLHHNEFFSIKKVFSGDREDIRKRATYFTLWNVLKIIRNRNLA
jgi:nicotinamide-nucleotide amidase